MKPCESRARCDRGRASARRRSSRGGRWLETLIETPGASKPRARPEESSNAAKVRFDARPPPGGGTRDHPTSAPTDRASRATASMIEQELLRVEERPKDVLEGGLAVGCALDVRLCDPDLLGVGRPRERAPVELADRIVDGMIRARKASRASLAASDLREEVLRVDEVEALREARVTRTLALARALAHRTAEHREEVVVRRAVGKLDRPRSRRKPVEPRLRRRHGMDRVVENLGVETARIETRESLLVARVVLVGDRAQSIDGGARDRSDERLQVEAALDEARRERIEELRVR